MVLMMKKISSRDLRRLLKKAQIDMEEIREVEKVVIETISGKKIIIKDPLVTKMKVRDQTIYQIVGRETMEEAEIKIESEDILIVMEQTGVDRETAKNALLMTNGDIAEAIMLLKGEKVNE